MKHPTSSPKNMHATDEVSVNGIDHPLLSQFLKDTGLSLNELDYTTPWSKGDERAIPTKIFYPKGEDIVIPYFSVDGSLIQFPNGSGKMRNFERTRWSNPVLHKDKNGEPMKYYQPQGTGTHIYFPVPVINLFRQKSSLKTIYLTEGEKKAIAGCKKMDLPVIGLPGIFGLKENLQENTLNKDLSELITQCGVKNIVLILDADALHAKFDPTQPEKDLYKRASLFFRSVAIVKELILPLEIDLYLAVINPSLDKGPKGLDDLLNVCEPGIIRDELVNLKAGKKEYTVWHNVTGESDTSLRKFFGLTNAEIFWEIHKEELKQNQFVLKRLKYQHDGKKLNIIKDTSNDVFWKAEKDKDGITKGCKIVYRKFIHFLSSKGFRRLDLNSDSFTFLQVEQNLIYERSETKIQDFVKNYVENLPGERLANDITKDDLAEKIYQSPQTYFSKPKLSLLDSSEFTIKRDSLTQAFVYFQNGFVEVTKDGYELKEYTELDNYIYADQQQKRNFKKGSEEGNFKKFVQNISGYDKNSQRFEALRTMLGYLMHDFHDYKLKAINFTDSKLSDDDEGRTGKTMLSRATQYLRNYLEVPGKTFDATKDTKYQHASLSTQIVHLNDAQRSFKTEYVYNDITEGIEIKKLYDKPYFIRVKYIISSNKTLQVWGASARDRFVEFELADHYSDTKTPEQEFKQWFFRDWDDNEWNAFYNFMLQCISLFLEKGILEADTINLEERKLINETNHEFVEFINIRYKDLKEGDEKRIVLKQEFNKKDLHLEFLNENKEFESDKYIKKQSTFTNWLKRYAKYNNLYFSERRSGADRYMTFKDSPE